MSAAFWLWDPPERQRPSPNGIPAHYLISGIAGLYCVHRLRHAATLVLQDGTGSESFELWLTLLHGLLLVPKVQLCLAGASQLIGAVLDTCVARPEASCFLVVHRIVCGCGVGSLRSHRRSGTARVSWPVQTPNRLSDLYWWLQEFSCVILS